MLPDRRWSSGLDPPPGGRPRQYGGSSQLPDSVANHEFRDIEPRKARVSLGACVLETCAFYFLADQVAASSAVVLRASIYSVVDVMPGTLVSSKRIGDKDADAPVLYGIGYPFGILSLRP